MRKFFELEIRVLLLITGLLVSMQIPAYLLLQEGTSGLLLYVFLNLLLAVALLTGPVAGLFSSLIFIFIIGSVLFYVNRPNSTLLIESSPFPLPLFLGYGLVLIILVLIAGSIHDKIICQGKKNRELQEEIRQFVAIDVETGFDNKHRMAAEVQAEMRRIERYGNKFTLVLLQLDHLEDYKHLYGEKETKHLLSSLAQAMQQTMRSTDRKFRYAADRFALLLTNTDDHSLDSVFEKLANRMTTHQLLNGKYVTLSFRSGYTVYEQDEPSQDYQLLFSQVESEMVAREL